MKERMNDYFRISVITLSLLIVVVGSVNAQELTAQDEKNHRRTTISSAPRFITGTITAVNGWTIEVLGGVFSLDLSQAEIRLASTGKTIMPEMITAGMQVSAVINNTDENNLSNDAVSISKAVVSPTGQGFLVGPIQEINLKNRSLKLYNSTILINDYTEFHGSVKELEDLQIGQTIVLVIQENAPMIVCEQTGMGQFIVQYVKSDPSAVMIFKESQDLQELKGNE